jgi:dynein heavy chain
MKKTLDYELNHFSKEHWTSDLNRVANLFIKERKQSKLFVWCEKSCIRYSQIEPPCAADKPGDGEFILFLKTRTDTPDAPITMDNIGEACFVKMMNVEDNMKSLWKHMMVLLPNFLKDTTWPENIKKDFLSQTHKFLAQLTEEISIREGKTRLYIPNEELDENMPQQDKKDQIQRLETSLIFWCRQIKDLLNNQVNQNDNDNVGPLDEISQWSHRRANLGNIKEQLDKKELKDIVDILSANNSSYLRNFRELSNQISEGAEEAEDNLRFLYSLHEPCMKIKNVTPKEIPEILPDLLNCVRMIWEKSNYYNTEDKINGLLRKISNEIIQRCRAHINLSDMLDGDVEKCMRDLDDSIDCGTSWKDIYNKNTIVINKYGKEWKIKSDSIFAQIEAFVQRCNDLKEICEGQIQFARKGSGIVLPKFSGTKGPEIVAVLEEIHDGFKKHLDKIRGSEQEKILDIKSTKWHDEYNSFKTGMKGLDNMYINLINFAFDSVTTVQQGVEFLEAFDYLARRSSIKNHVHKKIDKLNNLMLQEMKIAESSSKTSKLDYPIHHGKYSGKAVWCKSLLCKIERMKKQYDSLSFIDDD